MARRRHRGGSTAGGGGGRETAPTRNGHQEAGTSHGPRRSRGQGGPQSHARTPGKRDPQGKRGPQSQTRPQGGPQSQTRPQGKRGSHPNAHAGSHGSRHGAAGDSVNRARTSSITSHHGCDHVFFIGFLGAGKTTVARNLGNMFHRSYVDVDRMVERELHASVARIFQTRGESAFRDAETEALKTLGQRRSLLVSCGGGVIERAENIEIMRRLGKVVYLDGTLEDSLRQIRRPDKRPDLGDREHARELYAHRRPLYERACDLRVCISGKTFEQVALEVGEMLWERGLL